MATIREYFDTDVKALTVHADWDYRTGDGLAPTKVRAKIALDFDANARYWHFFVPPMPNVLECIKALFTAPPTETCLLPSNEGDMRIEVGRVDYPERQSSDSLVFTRRLVVYVDVDLGLSAKQGLVESGMKHGFSVVIRDRQYAALRSRQDKPFAFVAHDARDTDGLVRELALEMNKLMCPVWYDDYALKDGDSLRECVERGFTQAPKCVLILSANLFSNRGWGVREFHSVFTEEMLERAYVVLPVRHGVSLRDVYEYSPRLADRIGLPSSLGVPELARKLVSAVKAGL